MTARTSVKFASLFLAAASPAILLAASPRQVEEDWLTQARISMLPAHAGAPGVPTWADAAGAVDGLKDGKYAFHTAHEPNPWWQVDLGDPRQIARIVVYNRLDYPPGLHNADNLQILASNDARNWATIHDNKGAHFGGISGAPPLDRAFDPPVSARYIRLRIPSQTPVFFHLDQVEIYPADDPKKNIALKQPADQSSISIWSTAKITASTAHPIVYPTAAALDRAARLASELRQGGIDLRWFHDESNAIRTALDRLTDHTGDTARTLYLQARAAIRRLVFANPLLDFDRLLILKRFTQQTYPDVCLNHMPWVSRPGGDIFILTLKGPRDEPHIEPLLKGALGPGHVHGMDLSWDADQIVFGYAKAKTSDPPPGWLDRTTNYRLRRTEEPIHIFELDIASRTIRQITHGQWSDLDPTYAPNGDIVFVSERVACSLQCNEFDKDETSCNLFSCRPDGSGLRHLSVSKDGDYLPHTLHDGTIGYTRWEYQERGWAHIQSIWTIRPDGTGADALFKQHLNDPWALEDVRSIPRTGSSRLVAIATGHHTLAVGPVVIITPSVGLNTSDAIRIVTPGVYPPEGGMSGTPVDEGGTDDRGGYYSTPWPLSANHFLVSYSYSTEQTEPAGYGIYLIDVYGNKELLYRDESISSFVPIPLRPRPRPPIYPDLTDPNVPWAICSVSNVAAGVASVRPEFIRYIRIAHRLQWPYDNVHGGWRYAEKAWPRNWTPARIIGTVPVEADGSAHFKIPADTPVYFQLLDEDHMELRRMRSFISFQPGEQRSCVGCHETRAEAPSAPEFPAALRRAPRIPVPPPWGDEPISFLRDVQPILDRNCTRCHTGLKPAGGIDLSGGLTAHHNRAYDTMLDHDLIAWSNVNEDARITQPLEFGSHKSRLVSVLQSPPHRTRVSLSRRDWISLFTWIDANGPYHDRFINKRPAQPPYDLAADASLRQRLAEIHKRRCASCHEPAAVTRIDWIDLARPHQSLFLAAPLARTAAGRPACTSHPYTTPEDPDYTAAFNIVSDAVARALAHPRRDLEFAAIPDTIKHSEN